VEKEECNSHGNLQPIPLRVGKNQTGRIQIAFRNCFELAPCRSFVSKQQIAGSADTQETACFGIDRMGVLLRYLNTAELAFFLGSRFRLRLDEAFELRNRLPVLLAHERLPGSKFQHCKEPFPVLPEFVIPECFYRESRQDRTGLPFKTFGGDASRIDSHRYLMG